MNECDQTNAPPPIAPSPAFVLPPALPKPRPRAWWLRKFFACNPFYPVSAVLLLYGCYRVSGDAPFLNDESARLLFNFSSVQLYEILLVLGAIFLAHRSLWYDSTLLVGLENMLVFVPFILISQAALTGAWMAGAMCAVGVIVAVLRFGSLKRYFTQLSLPAPLLAVGAIMLALNVALPLAYRHYINLKIGVDLGSGPDYEMNEGNWLLVLPAALALVNFLPRVQKSGNLLPQRCWLPLGMFSLWFIVTGVHLYSLDYVYGYHLRSELLAPTAWVLAWTIFLRAPAKPAALKYALMFPALLAPFLATAPGAGKTFLTLTALNIAAYGATWWFCRGNRFGGHLSYASLLMLVSALPEGWIHFLGAGTTAAECVAAGLTAYVIFWAACLSNPKLAVLGSILFGWAIVMVFWNHPNAVNWAFQGGLVFFLLHSLRWNDVEHAGAASTRMLTGVVWVIQSFVWMHCDGSRFWMPFIPGIAVLGIYCACLPCRGIWRLSVVPAAAMVVILSGPCSMAIDCLRSTPVGLLAVVTSFLFLGLGTVAALTRELWHRHEHQSN